MLQSMAPIRFAFALLFLAATAAKAQPKLVKLAEIEKIIKTKSDTIQVINFWATWCGPCIKEMPLLENLAEQRKDVHVTLVSLDLDLDPNPEKVFKFEQRVENKSN